MAFALRRQSRGTFDVKLELDQSRLSTHVVWLIYSEIAGRRLETKAGRTLHNAAIHAAHWEFYRNSTGGTARH